MKRIMILAWLAVLSTAWGQQPSPASSPVKDALPSGPLIQPDAGEFAQWTVTLTKAKQKDHPKGSDAAASNINPSRGTEKATESEREVLQQITVTKTKQIIRVQTSSKGEVVEDRWIVGDAQVVTAPGMQEPYIIGGAHADQLLYPKKDFAELSWISKRNFVGIRKIANRDVMIFQTTLTIDYDGPKEQLSATAEIDLETRLPVLFQSGNQLRTYHFNPPPETIQQIPPEVEKVLKLAAQNRAVLNRVASRP